MKFIFIDTCIYVGCCLLETEGEEKIKEALEILSNKLKSGELKLLVPEVVELEFSKILEKRLGDISGEAKSIKDNIGTQKGANILKPKMVEDIRTKINDFVESRKRHTELTRKLIGSVFSHKNSIRLPLTSEIMLDAYKLTLSGKKPAKADKGGFQADCVIVASLKTFLAGQINYELMLCTNNSNDFSAKPETSDLDLHPDIQANFSQPIKYYSNLLDLLNKEFKTAYPPELIEKLAEESISTQEDTIQKEISSEIVSSDQRSSEEPISSMEIK